MYLALGFLLFSTVGVLLLGYVMLFGDSESHDKDCIGWLSRRLDYIFACLQGGEDSWLHRKAERVLGKTCCGRIIACQDYVFNQRNPIMPSIYVCFVTAGFWVFATFAFPFIPFGAEHPWGIAFYHKINAYWLVGACVAVFVANLRSDPGILTKDNIAEEQLRYPYDGIIYHRKACSTCLLPRPARSKHCSTCGHCCARFDHHCPWINNCVGAGNVRLFLAFLGLHVVLCLYGGLLLGFINKAIVEHEGLYSMRVRNRQTGELMPVTHAIVLKWLVHHHAPLVGLCISLTVIGLVLAGFFGYHLWLVARNTTTNESFKWTDLARQVCRLPLWRRRPRGVAVTVACRTVTATRRLTSGVPSAGETPASAGGQGGQGGAGRRCGGCGGCRGGRGDGRRRGRRRGRGRRGRVERRWRRGSPAWTGACTCRSGQCLQPRKPCKLARGAVSGGLIICISISIYIYIYICMYEHIYKWICMYMCIYRCCFRRRFCAGA